MFRYEEESLLYIPEKFGKGIYQITKDFPRQNISYLKVRLLNFQNFDISRKKSVIIPKCLSKKSRFFKNTGPHGYFDITGDTNFGCSRLTPICQWLTSPQAKWSLSHKETFCQVGFSMSFGFATSCHFSFALKYRNLVFGEVSRSSIVKQALAADKRCFMLRVQVIEKFTFCFSKMCKYQEDCTPKNWCSCNFKSFCWKQMFGDDFPKLKGVFHCSFRGIKNFYETTTRYLLGFVLSYAQNHATKQ